MTRESNIAHNFDLSGLKENDEFLGCSQCGFRLEPGEASKTFCPDCKSRIASDFFKVVNVELWVHEFKKHFEPLMLPDVWGI